MTLDEIQKTAAFLLNKIDNRHASANEIITDYTRTHRYIEGEERRQLLDLIWKAIRFKARLTYSFPDDDWLSRLKKMSDNELPPCDTAPNWVQWEVPEWFLNHVPDPEYELPALLGLAPIVLRSNGNRDKVMASLREEGLSVEPCQSSPYGIILSEFSNLSDSKTYKKGLVEIQDEGAQLVALDIGVKPKQDVFDFCAGAGGKSLIFAQMMNNRGFIQSYDAAPKRLFELVKRAKRAHISIIKIVTKLPEPFKKFDHVVVDAPCSGTGTWRRSPDMRWKLEENQLKNITQLQYEILDRAEAYVKPGHYLSYITCSLTKDENEEQIERFILNHPRYAILKQKRYSPWRTGTDGFFLCMMQKR